MRAFALIILALTVAQQCTALTTKEGAEIVSGLLDGLLQDNVDQVKTCITDTVSLPIDIIRIGDNF